MAVQSTKGLRIYISKGTATAHPFTPTAISKAKPAVVTVAAVTGIAAGDVVTFANTGFPELDNRAFVVGTVDGTANTFIVVGSDTTASTATLGATPSATVYEATDMQSLCLSSIEISAGSPNTIDISTFCNPGASLPGNPTPGTLTFSGYTDTTDLGYQELLLAEADGKERMLKIEIPGNGYLVAPVIIGSVGWTVPLEGAVAYNFSATMVKPLVHRF
jgi:hypothetical protein